MSSVTRTLFRSLLQGAYTVGRPSVGGVARSATYGDNTCDDVGFYGSDSPTTSGTDRSELTDVGERPLCVTLIEGHGAGPAVCDAVRKVLAAAAVPVQWDVQPMRTRYDPHTGRPTVHPDLVRSAEATGLVLRGPHTGLADDGSDGSPALTLHKALNAFVGVRAFASADGHQPHGRVRIVNVRDTVSGENSENEHTVVPGVVQTIKTVTMARSLDVATYAFNYAIANGHYRVTALHKANVMRMSDGMFLRACRHVSKCYPYVDYSEEKLDTFFLRVTDDPDRYDMLLTPSLYGALASAACGALSGGPATVPSAAYGPRVAVFSTMDENGTGRCSPLVANPTGLIRSAAWMLNHVGMTDAGLRVDAALRDTIRRGVLTRDMGGTASCEQFSDAVVYSLLHPCTYARAD